MFNSREQATLIIYVFVIIGIVVFSLKTNNKSLFEGFKLAVKLLKFPITWVIITFLIIILVIEYKKGQNLFIWCITYGISFCFRCLDTIKITRKTYFSRLKEIISITFFIEVFFSTVTFPILTEIVIQVCLIVLALFAYSAETMGFLQVKKIFNIITTSIVIIIADIILIKANFIDYASALMAGIHTIIASLIIFVLGYFINIYSRYSDIYQFVNVQSKIKIKFREKLFVMKKCHVSMEKLQKFRQKIARNTNVLKQTDRLQTIYLLKN